MLVVATLLLVLASHPHTAVLACSAAAPCEVGKTWDGTPKSAVQKDWAGTGLDAYVARPPASAAAADYAVLQIPDIYGLQLKNARLYADELAAATGATVVLPDLFYKPGAGAWAAGSNSDPAKFDAWLTQYPRPQVLADATKVGQRVVSAVWGRRGFWWARPGGGGFDGPTRFLFLTTRTFPPPPATASAPSRQSSTSLKSTPLASAGAPSTPPCWRAGPPPRSTRRCCCTRAS
jgi:hypothetical protein